MVAGLVPAHLEALERHETYELMKQGRPVDKKALKTKTLDRWQEEWPNGTKGGWMRRLIGDVKKWVSRKAGSCDFHLTQMLTRH